MHLNDICTAHDFYILKESVFKKQRNNVKMLLAIVLYLIQCFFFSLIANVLPYYASVKVI